MSDCGDFDCDGDDCGDCDCDGGDCDLGGGCDRCFDGDFDRDSNGGGDKGVSDRGDCDLGGGCDGDFDVGSNGGGDIGVSDTGPACMQYWCKSSSKTCPRTCSIPWHRLEAATISS